MNNLKYIWLVFCLCLCEVSFAQTKTNAVQWITFEQLTDSLAVNPKKVIIFLHTEWCGYCKKMFKETFTDPEIIDRLSESYYAVEMDAESTDTIYFDGVYYTHRLPKKKRGSYHELAKILLQNRRKIFPTLMILDTNFRIMEVKQNYLSIKQLKEIL